MVIELDRYFFKGFEPGHGLGSRLVDVIANFTDGKSGTIILLDTLQCRGLIHFYERHSNPFKLGLLLNQFLKCPQPEE
jgi:hypothetical protein